MILNRGTYCNFELFQIFVKIFDIVENTISGMIFVICIGNMRFHLISKILGNFFQFIVVVVVGQILN